MKSVDVELQPLSIHWLEEGDPHDDQCVHGAIYLRLGDIVVSDGTDTDWTLSAAAFRLLRTITNDHGRSIDEALIPHCGFTFWRIESATDGLMIPNCNICIDWIIRHTDSSQIEHVLSDGRTVYTDLIEWSRKVCDFSDQVFDFYQTAWPKNSYDEEDRVGFELFLNLWKERRQRAGGILDIMV